jgi:hypothetical protein
MDNDLSNCQKIQMNRQWYAWIRSTVGYKTLLALSIGLAFLFPDIAILVINNVIQLKINLLGFLLERVLQTIFDIPLREAQVLAAWIYLIVGVFIAWYLFKKVYLVSFVAFHRVRQNWSAKNQLQKLVIYSLIILLTVAFTKIALLFV